MALMVLAAEWCHSQGVRCSVITIDHDLRAGSADEAIFVARQLKNWACRTGSGGGTSA